MPGSRLRLRLVLWALALLSATALAPFAPAAQAAPTHGCRSTDLRYPFTKGGPNDFGVFRLRVTNGTCTTAHRVAKTWMRRFEARLRSPGRLVLPKHVDGFTFKTLRPHAAQTYTERGRRGSTTIRFDYVVPNG